MKTSNKILNAFQSVYCKFGIHAWITNPERIKVKFPDRNRTIDVSRYYRICSCCLKCQHSGAGIFANKWFDEDEKETNSRPIARSLKLQKLQNNIR